MHACNSNSLDVLCPAVSQFQRHKADLHEEDQKPAREAFRNLGMARGLQTHPLNSWISSGATGGASGGGGPGGIPSVSPPGCCPQTRDTHSNHARMGTLHAHDHAACLSIKRRLRVWVVGCNANGREGNEHHAPHPISSCPTCPRGPVVGHGIFWGELEGSPLIHQVCITSCMRDRQDTTTLDDFLYDGLLSSDPTCPSGPPLTACHSHALYPD